MAFTDITAQLNEELMQQFFIEKSALLESQEEPLTSIIKKPFQFTPEIKTYQIVFPGVFKYYAPENSQYCLTKDGNDSFVNKGLGFIQSFNGLEGTLVRLTKEIIEQNPNLLIHTKDSTLNPFASTEDFGYILKCPTLLINPPTTNRESIPILVGYYSFELMENTTIYLENKKVKPN